jgi:hypothetical protein
MKLKSKNMTYTIKIDNKSRKAKSIVNMLKELAEDYPFLTVSNDSDDIQENIIQELDARYEYMLKHPEDGESWEKVKTDLLNS